MAKIRRRSIDAAKSSSFRKKIKKPSIVRKKYKSRKASVSKGYNSLIKPKKRGFNFIWFFMILFLASFCGFLFYNKKENVVLTESLEMKIKVVDEIISGDQVEYIINYENLEEIKLNKIKLNIQWPSGFYFDEANIENNNSSFTTWLLPDLLPNEKKEIIIKGQLVGKKDDILQTIFNLSYQPDNFNSDFNFKKIVEIKIVDSNIELEINSVNKTLVSEEQDFFIKVKNLTNEYIKELYLDVLYPDDLEILNLDPQKEDKYWVLNLEPESEYILNIKGIFNKDSNNKQIIVGEVGNIINEKFRPLGREEKSINVIKPEFKINLTINGQEGNQNVDWGDILHYQLEVINNSDTNITDAQVNILLDGDSLDKDSIDSIGKYNNSIISWAKEELDDLEDWNDGEVKVFTLEVKVIDSLIAERLIENIVSINILGLKDWEQINIPILLNVGESISFNNGIYWDLGNKRVGSGSLPPKVGTETNYLVVWSLPESTGNFDSISINTILPPNVYYIEESDVQDGNLIFNEETKELNWNIDNFSEVILPTVSSFFIKLEPIEEYKGESMTLLNTTKVTAYGLEEVIISSKVLKTSDVNSDTNEIIGIIE